MANPWGAMDVADSRAWWEADRARLANDYGIVAEDVLSYLHPSLRRDISVAMDAQPALVTTSNTGVPAFLANYIDPKLIEVLVTPNKAAKILGEAKKGDWVTLTAMFPQVEHSGEVSSYGDWNNNGSTGANATFPQRQSYHYQTITQWGERQLDMAALGRIDWAQRLNVASAMVLDKFQNRSYFFGIQNLQNYGLLNDPSLSAAIAPGTKVNTTGGVKWVNGAVFNATGDEVFRDIQSLYLTVVKQTNGLVEADVAMKLCMSPAAATALNLTNQYNVNVLDQMKKNYPAMTVETAPEYTTAAGELVQLIVSELDGVPTGTCAFTEKMRAHAIIKEMSAFKQKKSQGTWGAVIFRPICIAQMIGV